MAASSAAAAASGAAGGIKVGVLNSLSGAMAISEVAVADCDGARLAPLLVRADAPGRLHHDEAFAYEQFRSDLDVHTDRGIVVRERQVLRPSEMDTQFRLGGFSHFATGYCFPVLTADLPQREGVLFGVCALVGPGSGIRALGHRAFNLGELMYKLLSVWRSTR